MKRSEFHFDLPEHLIARYPLAERTASRLVEMQSDEYLALGHGSLEE